LQRAFSLFWNPTSCLTKLDRAKVWCYDSLFSVRSQCGNARVGNDTCARSHVLTRHQRVHNLTSESFTDRVSCTRCIQTMSLKSLHSLATRRPCFSCCSLGVPRGAPRPLSRRGIALRRPLRIPQSAHQSSLNRDDNARWQPHNAVQILGLRDYEGMAYRTWTPASMLAVRQRRPFTSRSARRRSSEPEDRVERSKAGESSVSLFCTLRQVPHIIKSVFFGICDRTGHGHVLLTHESSQYMYDWLVVCSRVCSAAWSATRSILPHRSRDH